MPNIVIFIIGCWVGVVLGFIIFAFLNAGDKDDL
tara:strand:- start:1107 stop:1208 length:102 start_codon:yes stop_codon:yes gene_type:complete